jgi:hypothetical protein
LQLCKKNALRIPATDAKDMLSIMAYISNRDVLEISSILERALGL